MISCDYIKGTVDVISSDLLIKDSQRYHLNLCPSNNEVYNLLKIKCSSLQCTLYSPC